MRIRIGGAAIGVGAAMIVTGCSAASAPAAAGVDVHSSAWIRYPCESGREVAAAYPTDSIAFVRYGGTTYEMRTVVAANGARYTGGGYEWWTRGTGPGSNGTLARFAGDEVTASIPLERCEIPDAP